MVPDSWQTTAIAPVWKRKGDPDDASMYRDISVVHPLAKLYARVLLGRLDTAAAARHLHAPEQAGFRQGYRIEDHQLLLTYLMLSAAQGRGPLAVAFLDLEKAYDRVPHRRLWSVFVEELGISPAVHLGL